MKKIIKYFNIILIVIIILLAFWKIHKANKITHYYRDQLIELKVIKNKYSKKYSSIGRKLNLNNLKSLKNNKKLNLMAKDSKYIFLLLITKYNCPKCISKFVYKLNRFSDNNVQILIAGYNRKNMYKQKKHYYIKKPIFYIKKYEWFENNKFTKGPIAIIMDRKSQRILNLFNELNFINESEIKIVEYVKYLNKKLIN